MPASKAAQEHAAARAWRIYAALKQYAMAHQACPSNKLLGERFACSATMIANALNFLEAAGMIEIEHNVGGRIVTICDGGHRTAAPVVWKDKGRKAA